MYQILNKYQTPLTEELLNSLNTEVRDSLLDSISNIQFIQNLISPTREYAKDRPKDSQGRIVVDLCNPHILEDMDYFRPTALHYQKWGCMTKFRPNGNPNSEFGKWIRTELDRIWYGYVRESDGEWITGDMYFYLNYCPIRQSKVKKGTKIADRIVDFPLVWEGTYLWFHYVDQARNGGLYNNFIGGSHCVEIAKRGAGKAHPYSQDIYTPLGVQKWGDLKIGDQVFNNFGSSTTIIDIPFDAEEDIYEITLTDGRKVYSTLDHLWNVSSKRGNQTLTLRDIQSKYKQVRNITERNPSGVEYIFSIPNENNGVEYPQNILPIEPYTLGLLLGDGTFRNKQYNSVYFTSNPQDVETYRKISPYQIDQMKAYMSYFIRIPGVLKDLKILKLDNLLSKDKFIPEIYKYTSKEQRLSILAGLLDTDGYVDNKGIPVFTSVSEQLAKDVTFICRSLGINCKVTMHTAGYKKEGAYIQCQNAYSVRIYTDQKLFRLERKNKKIKLRTSKYQRSKLDRTTITNIQFSHKEQAKCITVDCTSGSYLVGEFIQTHNSYTCASMLARLFILGDNKETSKEVISVITAYLKDSLTKDGTLNKFEKIIDFCAEQTQFPSKRLNSTLDKMFWKMGYIDPDTETKKGTLNEVIGVTSKDNVDKARGKRSSKFIYEEFGAFPNFIDTWTVNKRAVQDGDYIFGTALAIGCVCSGSKIWDNYGNLTKIQDLIPDNGILGFEDSLKKVSPNNITYQQKPLKKECLKITFSSGRTLECSFDHPILVHKRNMTKWVGKRPDRKQVSKNCFIQAKDLTIDYFAVLPREVPITSSIHLKNARVLGWLIGDGSYGINKTPILSNCEKEINTYILQHFDAIVEKESYTKTGKLYQEIRIKKITQWLRNMGIYGQTKSNKRLPTNIQSYDKISISEFLGGLFDTDGHIDSKRAYINLSQNNKEILLEVQLLLQRLGVQSIIRFQKPNFKNPKSKNGHYELQIRDIQSIISFHKNISLFPEYKIQAAKFQQKLITGKTSKLSIQEYHDKIVKIESIGEQFVYNLTADTTHTYLVNGIVTHNTGGTEGNDFSGALEMLYNPIGYNVYALPNVFDKNSQGKSKTIFFFGAYLNRLNCYNKDGVSDVIAALIEILKERIIVKYNTTDPLQITRTMAEDPITIQEAVMKRDATIYPIADLTDRLNQLDFNPGSLDDIYTGKLSLVSGKIIYSPSIDAIPIREFPHKDNKLEGCIEIHQMPEVDKDGVVYGNRYIAGIDPYDDDASMTLSLGSLYILDLWTDSIVLEYTGRPLFAADFYELCRKALLFYNAKCNYENNKKGLFTHFSKMNSLYLLTDTLDFLKDLNMMKEGLYGNKVKGTISSAPIKAYGRRCIRDWLLKPITQIVVVDGVETEQTFPLLVTIKSRALLKELLLFNLDGNFDRHDALVMLMLLREDKLRLMGSGTASDARDAYDSSYLGEDPFFKRNYEEKFSKLTSIEDFK